MGNDAKTTQTPMVKVGERLREVRERKSLTIDQVQKQTSIHSTVLKALEEGRCDEILTPTYVKSFLKKYAEYLGLDTRPILGEYALAHQSPTVTALGKVAEPPAEEPLAGTRLIKVVVIAVAAIALVFFVGAKTIGLFKRMTSEKASSATKSETAPSKKKAVAAQKESSAKRQLAAFPIPKSAPLKLLIKVNQPVLVRLKTDGNLIFERVLQDGASESFTATDRINIYVAKAEAIELILNKKNLGSPGKGLIRNIEITRTGIKIR